MTEIVWQEIKKNGEIVTKQRTFKTEKAAEKFIEKLYDRGDMEYPIRGNSRRCGESFFVLFWKWRSR